MSLPTNFFIARGGGASVAPLPSSSFNVSNYTLVQNHGGGLGGAYGLEWNPTGSRFYIAGGSSSGMLSTPSIFEYSVGSNYNLSSTSQQATLTSNWNDSYPSNDIQWINGGDALLVSSYTDQRLYQLSMGTSYSLSSWNNVSSKYIGWVPTASPGGFKLTSNGLRLYMTARTQQVRYMPLSTAGDISTVGSQTTLDLANYTNAYYSTPTNLMSAGGSLYGMDFFTYTDGTHWCLMGTRSTNILYAFQLATAEDLTTIGAVQSVTLGYSIYDVITASNGVKMWTGAGSGSSGDVVSYTL